MAEQELAVQMVNISKYFGGICAVHNANLTVKKEQSMHFWEKMALENRL